jgi:undecaprenyl-diphosphatase
MRQAGRRRWWWAAATAFAVAAATEVGRGRDLDRALFRRLNAGWHPALDAALLRITELGSVWASVGAGSVLALRGRRREALDAVGAAAAMWAVGQLAKRMVDRPRPYVALRDPRLLIEPPRATSWPSSHPAVLLSFLSVAGRDLGLGGGARLSGGVLVGTVGVSRVVLGVHYPADVLGGVLLGIGVADLWSATVSPRLLGRGSVQ